jgi:hypothetical protein
MVTSAVRRRVRVDINKPPLLAAMVVESTSAME